MAAHVLVHVPSAAPERRTVAGAVSAGGGETDAIALPGAPAGALLVVAAPAGVLVEAQAEDIRAAGKPLARGARRLLLPGERAEVAGSAIEAPATEAAEETRALAGALLREVASGGAPVRAPHMLVLSGPDAGRTLPLGAEETVGRGRAATLRLDDAKASRLHARIRIRTGSAFVEDLGSKNGVRVNGARIPRGERRLEPRDEIALGASCLAFIVPDARMLPAGPSRDAAQPPAEPAGAPGSIPLPPPAGHRPLALAAALLGLCAAALAVAAGL